MDGGATIDWMMVRSLHAEHNMRPLVQSLQLIFFILRIPCHILLLCSGSPSDLSDNKSKDSASFSFDTTEKTNRRITFGGSIY
jgi:hypothetical protein